MKIAVTGATGFVGTRLVERLVEAGHSVVALTRSKTHGDRVFPKSAFPSVEVVEYSPLESGEWQRVLSGCDGVVNLAGAGIADKRWTPERKQEILDSRKIGTEKIVEAIAQASPKPSVLVNSSAIGYYGTSETATFDESSAPGDDFLAQVCQAWDVAAESATLRAIWRTACIGFECPTMFAMPYRRSCSLRWCRTSRRSCVVSSALAMVAMRSSVRTGLSR